MYDAERTLQSIPRVLGQNHQVVPAQCRDIHRDRMLAVPDVAMIIRGYQLEASVSQMERTRSMATSTGRTLSEIVAGNMNSTNEHSLVTSPRLGHATSRPIHRAFTGVSRFDSCEVSQPKKFRTRQSQTMNNCCKHMSPRPIPNERSTAIQGWVQLETVRTLDQECPIFAKMKHQQYPPQRKKNKACHHTGTPVQNYDRVNLKSEHFFASYTKSYIVLGRLAFSLCLISGPSPRYHVPYQQ